MELPQKEQEEQQLLWKSTSEPESMITVTLGRVMSTLLSAHPKKLHDSISRLSPQQKTTSLGNITFLKIPNILFGTISFFVYV